MADRHAPADLWRCSAFDLADLVSSAEVKPSEVVQAHLDRIAAVNPKVPAVATVAAEQALSAARKADAAAAKGAFWGPLHGVPFTVTDLFATAGLRTTCGSPSLADEVPVEDAVAVSRLRRFGGVVLGKTNTSAFGRGAATENELFGRTPNPWDRDRDPGGAAGGAAAAVATGMTPFDLTSDTRGSARSAASFCGVWGLRPTPRRVSVRGGLPGLSVRRQAAPRMSPAFLARSVADLTLAYAAAAGADHRDPSVPPVPVRTSERVKLKGLKLAVWSDPGGDAPEVSSAVEDALELMAETFTEAGSQVAMAAPAAGLAQAGAAAEAMARVRVTVLHLARPDQVPAPEPPATPLDSVRAVDLRAEMVQSWSDFFVDWDLLLMPCVGDVAPTYPVDHEELGRTLAFTVLPGLAGHPALAVPAEPADGLPVGVQLVAPRWGDGRLLAAAHALEPMLPQVDVVEPA